jgi:hypothetical protein
VYKLRRIWPWAVGAIYAIAWFVQVIKDGQTLADGTIPGWEALRAALSPLWKEKFNGNQLEATLSVSSGLTNIAFAASFLWLSFRPTAASRPWAWLLFCAAAINTFWIFDALSLDVFRAGYWLWLASFLLLGFVAYFRPAVRSDAA